MKIEIHDMSVRADIIIGEEADVYDCVNAFIGAMIIEGWEIELVHDAFKKRAKDMEGIDNEV